MRLVFAFLLSIWTVNALSPGAQIHLTQAGINQAIKSLLQQALVGEQSFNVENQEFQEYGVKVHLENILIKFSNIDIQNTQVRLHDNGDITAHTRVLKMEATSRFKAKWVPLGIKFIPVRANGDVRVNVDDAHIDITLGIVNENGKARIVNKRVHAHIGNPRIYVGGSLARKPIEKILDMFKGFLRRKANDHIVDELNKKLQTLSDRLVNIDMEKPLRGKLNGISINYGLTSNPSVANSAFTIPVATQFWYDGHKNEALVLSSGPYPFGAPSKMVCIDADTNILFGTLAHAYKLQNGPPLSKTITLPLPTDIKNRIMKQVVGCDCDDFFCPLNWIAESSIFCSTNTEIKAQIVNNNRDIYFNSSGVYLTLSGTGSADIMVKDKGTCVLNAEITITVHLMENIKIDNWTFKGNAVVLKPQINASSPLFGKIDDQQLDALWESELENHIGKWIDELSKPGIPLPQLEFATFHNTQVEFHGPFVRVCSDIGFRFDNFVH